MEKLFLLVKSLDAMEKRYFRLAVSVHKEAAGKNYMRLFDAIHKQKAYDEEALRLEFKGEAIVKRFDMSKNYLYKLLLNTLQTYHRGASVEQQLRDMLSQAGILYQKRLYKSALEILQRARKLARRYDYYEILLQVIQLLMRIALEEHKDIHFTAAFYPEHRQALERIGRVNEYSRLYHELYAFFSKRGNDLRVPGVKKQYRQFLRNPLLSGKHKPLSYDEKSYYYLTCGLCYFCMGEADKSYLYTEQRLKLIHSRPEKILEDPDTYITALNSVIFYGSVLCKISEAEQAFGELEQFLESYPAKRYKIFVAYDNMMALYLTAGLFREGIVYANKAEQELDFFEDKLFASNKVSLYHDMFYIYFGCKQYSRSLIWLNKLLNETTLGVREDIQVTARLTNLILHYELGNFDLLPYLLRSTYAFLYSRKRLHSFEKILLKFIGKLLHVDLYVKKDIIMLFREIKESLETLTHRPDEAMVLTEYFDYVSWLESKITNRSFEKIMKEKAIRKLPTKKRKSA